MARTKPDVGPNMLGILEKILPKVGDQLGKYELTQVLGRGGFGIVFKAQQLSLGQDVAVKILLPSPTDTHDQMQTLRRFEREAQVLRQLEHPCALKIYDFGSTPEGLPFLITEFVRGDTLDSVLQDGPLEPIRVVRIADQILGCLAEAHHLGILHRDLKPANIMVRDIYGESDSVKVLDFGIAKFVRPDEAALTQTGLRFGTPQYMSPEQAKGLKDIDGRLDLYTLGLIIAECLTGRRVVQIKDAVAAVMAHAQPKPHEIEPTLLSSVLGPIVSRALEKDPARRFPDAIEMRSTLSDVKAALLGSNTLAASIRGEDPLGERSSATGPSDTTNSLKHSQEHGSQDKPIAPVLADHEERDRPPIRRKDRGVDVSVVEPSPRLRHSSASARSVEARLAAQYQLREPAQVNIGVSVQNTTGSRPNSFTAEARSEYRVLGIAFPNRPRATYVATSTAAWLAALLLSAVGFPLLTSSVVGLALLIPVPGLIGVAVVAGTIAGRLRSAGNRDGTGADRSSARAKRIVDVLGHSGERLTISQLAADLRWSEEAVVDGLDRLVKDGRVIEDLDLDRGKWCYELERSDSDLVKIERDALNVSARARLAQEERER